MKPLLTLALLAGASSAQVASSGSYQIVSEEFTSAGGGQCSISFAAFVDLSGFSAESISSPGYVAEIGFLAANDPAPGNGPLIFGIAPNFGHEDGGTGVTISGLNFDKFGAGANIFVELDGVLATDVNLVSDTQVTATMPAGEQGPLDVEVTTAYGSDIATGGFINTPAITCSPTAAQGGFVDVRNYGPPNTIFYCLWSTVTTEFFVPGQGFLLIGPAPLYTLYGGIYPPGDGIHESGYGVPFNPNLTGRSIHHQTLVIHSLDPVHLQLTNRASVTFL